MKILALKMLIGNKAALIGVVFGIFLATLLISQQSAIFLGLISRSYRIVTDTPQANIWIIDPATKSDKRIRSIPKNRIQMIRSVPGVEWAEPLNITVLPIKTSTGIFNVAEVYGVDDASLAGAPLIMVEGRAKDLRREGGVIVDIYSAATSLAKTLPNGKKEPLKVGDEIEINKIRTVVVGLAKPTQGFYPQPILFTTSSLLNKLNPGTKNAIDFIIARTTPGTDAESVIKKINAQKGLLALTRDEMSARVVKTFLETGILINFGLSVVLACIVGLSIAGQTFYMMTEHNLSYYALIKALGGSKSMILQMIGLQVILVGSIGFCLGIGVTYLWGFAIEGTTLAFYFPFGLLVFTGCVVMGICFFTAGISIRKVFSVDPKVLMGN